MAKARIMVVEDEGLVAMSIRETLQGLGYEVPVIAMNGEEAVRKLLETEPDLVLMDIQLKGGANGIETARRIRERLDVPVVYLTAFSDSDTLEQAQLTEPYGYVLKPYDEKGLHAVIQVSLLKHRRTRSARENGWWMTAVAESMMEAVVICDPKGYIKFANAAAEPLLGLPRPQLLEKRLSEVIRLLDADSRQAMEFPVSLPLLEGRSTVTANCRIVSASGKEVPVDLSSSPLRSPEGTLFGILYVFRKTTERERLQTLVLRELAELTKMRQKILPSSDTALPGLRFESLFLPSVFGCGDAMGCFCLDESHVAFYSLDVIGQGIVSSVFSLLLHTFLSPHPDRGGMLVAESCSEPRRRILSPVEVVRELHRRFFQRGEANPYFTMVYGVLESATGLARLVRAGHPFPILQTAAGEIRALKPEGYAVGLFPSADVAPEEIRLSAGDRLFLCSDGLVDCANPGGAPFSSPRLTDCIRAGRGAPLAEAVQSIGAAVLKWRDQEMPADDVSLLALEKE